MSRFRPELSRRRLLQDLGIGAAFLPLLRPQRAQGQTAAFPRRLLIVLQTGGAIAKHFFPTGASGSLANLTLPLSTAPLDPYKNDVTIIDGLAIKNTVHFGHEAYCATFTGTDGVVGGGLTEAVWANGPSIEQVIAAALPPREPFRSVAMGVQVDASPDKAVFTRSFFKAADTPITPESNPANVMNAIFRGQSLPPAQIDKLPAERRSMLDLVGRDLVRFSKRLATEDRAKIDAHLQAIRAVERQLSVPAATSVRCTPPSVPATFPDPGSSLSYRAILNAHFDLAVAALSCGVTRVATVQINCGRQPNPTMAWLDLTLGNVDFGSKDGARNYHDVAHHPGPDGIDKAKADRWYMEQLAALIARLKAVPEGNGTMLDNTLLVWANHMGDGARHDSARLPWVLAGSCGGYFRTGRYLKVGVEKQWAPVNGVLVAMANAMGVPMTTFGDAKYGPELPGLRG